MSTLLARRGVIEQPLWFGDASHPVAGWLTTPSSGRATSGVLLVPTIGREARTGRRALRALAHALARSNMASLRFDLEGTGDASGRLDEPGRVDAWTGDVAAAAATLRAAGVATVHGVGLRLGATLLAAAASRHDLSLRGLVLWDPCESGRAFVRELRALETMRREPTGERDDGGVETPEYLLCAELVAELGRLRLSELPDRPLAEDVLVVARSDRRLPDRLTARLEKESPEWRTTDEQGALLNEEPLFAVLPATTIRGVAAWLAARGGAEAALRLPAGAERTALGVEGGVVQERFVRLGRRDLFGIVTEPDGEAGGPWVVLLNVSNEEHIGPSRLWVELARRWALDGLRSVRFDLTGLGDSPPDPRDPAVPFYERPWYEDVRDVAAALSPGDPGNVVLIGLCSGAFLSVEAGLALGARGVCVVNPPSALDLLYGISVLDRRQTPLARHLVPYGKKVALHLRWVSVVLLKALRVLAPRTFRRDALASLVRQQTDLYVLASREDVNPWPEHRALDRFFGRQFVAPRGYEVTFVEGLDHSMHNAEGKLRVEALLAEHVRDAFAPTPTTGASGEGATAP